MRLHLVRQGVQVIRGVGPRSVLEERHVGNEVGLGAANFVDSKPLLAFADEEEAVVSETLVLDDLADAADVGGGTGVGEDDSEAEVGVEEGVHHDAVAELEDLEGEDSAGEEDEWEREEGELDGVGNGGGAAAEGAAAAEEEAERGGGTRVRAQG